MIASLIEAVSFCTLTTSTSPLDVKAVTQILCERMLCLILLLICLNSGSVRSLASQFVALPAENTPEIRFTSDASAPFGFQVHHFILQLGRNPLPAAQPTVRHREHRVLEAHFVRKAEQKRLFWQIPLSSFSCGSRASCRNCSITACWHKCR